MNRIVAAGFCAVLVVASAASAGDICGSYRRFTMVGNNFLVKTFVCEQCYGDAVNNGSPPDFCPSSGSDVCNGKCSNNSSISCLSDSECTGGTCQTVPDGIITKCYGSGNDSLSNVAGPVIVDLGGGDDNITITSGYGSVIQGGTGNDTITFAGTTYTGDNWVNGGPFATSGSDISGDDKIVANLGASGDVWIGGGGRDVMKNTAGAGGTMGTTGGTAFGAYPKVADDSVGSVICGGGDMTILAAGPRHQCIEGGTVTNHGATCYYQYDNAVLGTRSADGASDIGTIFGCTTRTHLGTGGLFESPSTARCGCDN